MGFVNVLLLPHWPAWMVIISLMVSDQHDGHSYGSSDLLEYLGIAEFHLIENQQARREGSGMDAIYGGVGGVLNSGFALRMHVTLTSSVLVATLLYSEIFFALNASNQYSLLIKKPSQSGRRDDVYNVFYRLELSNPLQ